ncbi:MAG TPA: shikimate kinase [Micropepsaceae bacterium]|nr:shikimate kinase [Micropepsaceae bacterium]HRK71911.1 shikimate kinase [Micropepsaceae bacterium]
MNTHEAKGQSPAANPPRPKSERTIVLVGLMGVGKTTIGRRLAQALNLPFSDADAEIEQAAGCSIADFFELYGEPAFRAGERRVIARLLDGPRHVLATGGGAFMDAGTRALTKERAVTVWLKADLDLLMKRVLRKQTRPLLKNDDPRGTMERLIAERYPVYAEADVTVETSDQPHDRVVRAILDALERHGVDIDP